jgi:hypothetical protein
LAAICVSSRFQNPASYQETGKLEMANWQIQWCGSVKLQPSASICKHLQASASRISSNQSLTERPDVSAPHHGIEKRIQRISKVLGRSAAGSEV